MCSIFDTSQCQKVLCDKKDSNYFSTFSPLYVDSVWTGVILFYLLKKDFVLNVDWCQLILAFVYLKHEFCLLNLIGDELFFAS